MAAYGHDRQPRDRPGNVMSWVSQVLVEIRVRLESLIGRGRLMSRVDEEMRLHLEMRAERLMESGLSREQAYLEARSSFGNPAVVREATLDAWRYAFVETGLRDLRYAARLLRRNPVFAFTAALSLAVGI